jgi:hypothetical protein
MPTQSTKPMPESTALAAPEIELLPIRKLRRNNRSFPNMTRTRRRLFWPDYIKRRQDG